MQTDVIEGMETSVHHLLIVAYFWDIGGKFYIYSY